MKAVFAFTLIALLLLCSATWDNKSGTQRNVGCTSNRAAHRPEGTKKPPAFAGGFLQSLFAAELISAR
jgi:hypothetical protein